MSSLGRLCEACEALWRVPRTVSSGTRTGDPPTLFEDTLAPNVWAGSHHIEKGEFLSAVLETKCYVCCTIYRDFSPELRDQASLFRTFYRLHLIDGHDGSRDDLDHYELEFTVEMLSCQLPLAQKRVYECTGTFKVLPKSEIPNFPEELGLTENTFTDKCKQQVGEWLDNCTKHHRLCNVDSRTSHETPARLLDVSREGRFTLQIFDRNAKCPRYVTLSHCWESTMPTRLLYNTLEEMQRGMSLSKLPKRFEEAVKIAKWMKINYIWIDALCIMQDSEEDWLDQSVRMGDIYAGSYCNIAATMAGRDRGCFTKRFTAMVEPFAVRNPRSHNPALTHFIGYDDFWSNSLLDSRLHNRGWVLQERLLSPRTIHFGQEQMFWECRTEMACEAYPRTIPVQFRNHKTEAWRKFDSIVNLEHDRNWWQNTVKYLQSVMWPSTSILNPLQLSTVHKAWSAIVERYMECKLSHGEDKLVAISGIAQKLAKITNQRYLAGLWDDPTLPLGLLWYVLRRRQADGTPSSRSAPSTSALKGQIGYRAPSWSWASMEAKVIWPWPVHSDCTLVDVVRTQVHEFQGSSMGKVIDAVMELRGRLFQGSLSIRNRSANGTPDEDGQYRLLLTNGVTQTSMSEPDSAAGATIEPIIYLDTPLLPQSSSVQTYLLPVCTGWKGRPGDLITSLAGLLLKESTRPDKPTAYERIGIFGMNETQASTMCGVSFECVEEMRNSNLSGSQTLITLI